MSIPGNNKAQFLVEPDGRLRVFRRQRDYVLWKDGVPVGHPSDAQMRMKPADLRAQGLALYGAWFLVEVTL